MLENRDNNLTMDGLFDNFGKLTVDSFYEYVCDYIEKNAKKMIRREKLACYGGKCVFTICSQAKPKGLFAPRDLYETDEFVEANVTLYFQNNDKQWIQKKMSGKVRASKFVMNDKKTAQFFDELYSEDGVEQKIDEIK